MNTTAVAVVVTAMLTTAGGAVPDLGPDVDERVAIDVMNSFRVGRGAHPTNARPTW